MSVPLKVSGILSQARHVTVSLKGRVFRYLITYLKRSWPQLQPGFSCAPISGKSAWKAFQWRGCGQNAIFAERKIEGERESKPASRILKQTESFIYEGNAKNNRPLILTRVERPRILAKLGQPCPGWMKVNCVKWESLGRRFC